MLAHASSSSPVQGYPKHQWRGDWRKIERKKDIEEREKERERQGIEPTAAEPGQPDCPGVSRSDHSAGSKESASWRAVVLELRSDWHGRDWGLWRGRKKGTKQAEEGARTNPPAQDKEENGSWTNARTDTVDWGLEDFERMADWEVRLIQPPFFFLSCAGSSWLPLPLVSFPSFPSSQPPIDHVSPSIALKLVTRTKLILLTRPSSSGLSD